MTTVGARVCVRDSDGTPASRLLELGAQSRSAQILDDVVAPAAPVRFANVDDDLDAIAPVIVGETRIEADDGIEGIEDVDPGSFELFARKRDTAPIRCDCFLDLVEPERTAERDESVDRRAIGAIAQTVVGEDRPHAVADDDVRTVGGVGDHPLEKAPLQLVANAIAFCRGAANTRH